jgi:hypothetical protein
MLTSRQEFPLLCYIDHAKDEIYQDLNFLFDINFDLGFGLDLELMLGPDESECTIEIQLERFLSSVVSHPLYMPDILPNTRDRSLWDAKRKRLAALLLEEVKRVRQSPVEVRDWDLDKLE